MQCKKCGDAVRQGHSLKEGGPEEFCSYKCLEAWTRENYTGDQEMPGLPKGFQSIMEHILEQITKQVSEMTTGAPKLNLDLVFAEHFGRWGFELAGAGSSCFMYGLNDDMRALGVKVGYGGIETEQKYRSENLAFCHARTDFVGVMRTGDKDVFILRPKDYAESLRYLLRQEVRKQDTHRTTALTLLKAPTTEAWTKRAGVFIQKRTFARLSENSNETVNESNISLHSLT